MMKKILWSLAVCLVSLFVIASLSGCKGPEGPTGLKGDKGDPGANGTNGTNGTNGVNAGFVYFEGFKDSLRCANCHDLDKDTSNYVAARVLQCDMSGHNTLGDFDENRGACAVCHTTEGFILRIKNGNSLTAVTDRFDPTPVGCFACHSPHVNGNFARRVTTPVTLVSNVTGIPNATFDDGDANMCAQCHQPRTSSSGLDMSKMGATDSISISSSRWGPHHGLQAMLLKGAGGVYIELPGYTYNNSTHAVLAAAKNLQCPDCHMADASPSAANAGRVGGHTMNIAFTDPTTNATTFNVLYSCNTAINGSTCHSAGSKIAPAATATDVLGLEHNGKVKAVKDSLQALQVIFAQKNWVDTVANTVKSPLRIQARKAAALWNFILVREDRSTGIHNSQYALDILTAGLAEIRKP